MNHDRWAADNQRRWHGKRQIDSDAEVNACLGGRYGSQQNRRKQQYFFHALI